MKTYKVYLQADYETIVEAETPDLARIKVCDNLSDYFIDSTLNNCVVKGAVKVKN